MNSRDGYVFTRVNTVVNAYAAQTTAMLAEMGIGGQQQLSKTIVDAMQVYLFDSSKGRCVNPKLRIPSLTRMQASHLLVYPSLHMDKVLRWTVR
jgi:hypothetical protein